MYRGIYIYKTLYRKAVKKILELCQDHHPGYKFKMKEMEWTIRKIHVHKTSVSIYIISEYIHIRISNHWSDYSDVDNIGALGESYDVFAYLHTYGTDWDAPIITTFRGISSEFQGGWYTMSKYERKKRKENLYDRHGRIRFS